MSVAFLGSISRVLCTLDDGQEVVAQVSSGEGAALRPHDRVRLTASPEPVLVVGGAAETPPDPSRNARPGRARPT